MRIRTAFLILALLVLMPLSHADLGEKISSSERTGEKNPCLVYPCLAPLVEVEIYPETQVMEKKKTIYEVVIRDYHRPIVCVGKIKDTSDEISTDSIRRCEPPRYTYKISVDGLPFKLEFPEEITLGAQEKTSFELVVYSKKKSFIDNFNFIGRANDNKFKYEFTVTATLETDETQKASDTAVLLANKVRPE